MVVPLYHGIAVWLYVSAFLPDGYSTAMDRLSDQSEYEWIRETLPPLASASDPEWKGNYVSHCLPNRYARYLKLLHPIYVDESIANEKLTWDDVAREERPVRRAAMSEDARRVEGIIHNAGAVVRQSQPDRPFPAKRVFWRDLARKWKRAYHAAITDRGLVPSMTSWPRYLVGPAEGDLDAEQRTVLADALEPFTEPNECFFWWMTIFRDEPMWRGNIAEYPHAHEVQQDGRSPNMTWPEQRDWCICTDYDLCFTLIGCSAPIADALRSRPELELLEVTATTRIDFKADTENASRQ